LKGTGPFQVFLETGDKKTNRTARGGGKGKERGKSFLCVGTPREEGKEIHESTSGSGAVLRGEKKRRKEGRSPPFTEFFSSKK